MDSDGQRWDFETVLKYFKKSENNQAPDLIKNTTYHSTKGPLKVDYYKNNNTVLPIILDGFKELGFPEIQDFNADQSRGFSYAQGTLADGQRQSTAKAFLSPIKNRPNIHVIKHAHVTSLDIDGDRVTAVNFNYNSRHNLTVRPGKEVILSAGVIGSAQIMMLSGIGPRLELESLGIHVKKDLPVGRNLQDHAYIPVFLSLQSELPPSTPTLLIQQFLEYLTSRTGAFATMQGHMIGFINTKDPLSNIPDIQYNNFAFAPQSGDVLAQMLGLFGYVPEIINHLVKVNQNSTIAVALVTISNPKSKGKLILHSSDPYDKPIIINNYLDHKDDIESAVKGLQMYSKLENTEISRKYNGKVIRFNLPRCDEFPYDSDLYWECYSRQFTSSMYHPAGTAKMGPLSDPESVVDPNLKVKGMDNLRVIDGSIMPTIVTPNINPACIMIGERGADLVKADWQEPIITN